MNKKVVLIAIVASVLFTACKTTKKIEKSDVPTVNLLAERIMQIQQSQPQFSTANISKVSMDIQLNDREFNVSATIKVRKDSALHISIQPFMGIEMFKLELTPDSMRAFDKMNRRYYVLDYGYFAKRFGVNVDYYSIQSLIFNQLFCIGNREVLTDSCTFSVLDNGKYSVGYQSENMTQSSLIDLDNTIKEVLLKSKIDKYEMLTTYSDFNRTGDVNFPQKIAMLITNQKSKVTCDIGVEKIEFNNRLKISPSNSTNYTRADVNQLLKK